MTGREELLQFRSQRFNLVVVQHSHAGEISVLRVKPNLFVADSQRPPSLGGRRQREQPAREAMLGGKIVRHRQFLCGRRVRN